MGFLFVLIFIAIFAGFVFVAVKMANLRERATQHILKGTGISQSDINSGIQGSFEKKQLQTFLNSNPNYTEESVKALLKNYASNIFNKNPMPEFSAEVTEKMQNDSKLDKMQTMIFRRATINGYSNNKLMATIVYTDDKDEYEIYMVCNVNNDKIQVEKYRIQKGAVVGF